MLLNDAFSLLAGHMRRANYGCVLAEMRLADGTVWSLPMAPDMTSGFSEPLATGQSVTAHQEPDLLCGEIGRLKVELDWLKNNQVSACSCGDIDSPN
jgi:sulfate adenylyltransferase